MGKISDDFVNNLLDVAFGSAVSAFPVTYYIGLSSTLPTNIGGNITEPVGNAYERVTSNNDDLNWGPAATRVTTNVGTITFPTATGTGWGDLTHFVLMDAAVDGAMVAWGALDVTLSVGNGSIPTFDPGTLVITAPGT